MMFLVFLDNQAVKFSYWPFIGKFDRFCNISASDFCIKQLLLWPFGPFSVCLLSSKRWQSDEPSSTG